ncbi:Cyclin-dependent kinase 2-associated protein 1 [Myotis brandtii]|uniref:Cyclin-dependent kinase 2-associated protein 1 n=1 Tax=Myotis brandtii TaxID=109478 RepID=S7MH11_MYOBR|nr:Cyclin-dependent kinase 2-associated protein 1 [Myotis brandtii]
MDQSCRHLNVSRQKEKRPSRPVQGGFAFKTKWGGPELCGTDNHGSRRVRAGSVHPPSTGMATSSGYRQLLIDCGPPSLGFTQGTGNSQVPQSKYAELLAILEELGKEI